LVAAFVAVVMMTLNNVQVYQNYFNQPFSAAVFDYGSGRQW